MKKTTLFVDPAYVRLFASHGVRTFDDFTGLHTNDIKSEKQRRKVSMFSLTKEGVRETFFIKTHEGRLALPFIIARRSPAIVEAINCKILASQGVPVPFVAAYGVVSQGCRFRDFLITKKLENCVSLEEKAGSCESAALRRLIKPVAEFTSRVHEKGIIHRDYYAGHIYIEQQALKPRVFLIDLERVTVRKNLRLRWKVKDCASLCFSLPQVSVFSKLRFFSRYCALQQIQGPKKKSLLKKISRKVRRIQNHTARVIRKGGWT